MPFQRPVLIDAYKRVRAAIHELNTSWSVFYSRMSTDALHYYLNSDGADGEPCDDGLLEAWFEGYCDENGIAVDEGFDDSGYVVRKEHPDDLVINREDYNRVLSYFIELVHITQRNVNENEFVKFYIRRIDDASRELARYKQALVELYANDIYEELKGKPPVSLTEYVIAKSNDTGLYDAIRGLEHEFSLDINELTLAIELTVGARLNADKQSN